MKIRSFSQSFEWAIGAWWWSVCVVMTGTSLATGVSLYSDEGRDLSLWGSARLRFESQNNFNTKSYGDAPVGGQADDTFLLGRFQLGVKYDAGQHLSLSVGTQYCQPWDLVFGQDDFYNGKFQRDHSPYEEDPELFDTYLELKGLLDNTIDIKIGRQRLFYGNNRVFGPGQWGNTGRWGWDAARVSCKLGSGFVDAFYGQTLIHDPDTFSFEHGHGFESLGLYSHFELQEGPAQIGIEPFIMTKNNDRATYKGEDTRMGDLASYYAGLRIYGNDLAGFDADGTYLVQRGDWGSDNLEAYAYHVLLAYPFKDVAFQPRVSVAYSFASGDRDPTDGKHETFDGAFGARDKMYGRMNLFHWQNLKDAQINLEIKPARKARITAQYHEFWLAEKTDAWYLNPTQYRDKTGVSGDKVGREIDVVSVINLPQNHQIQFGYGHFWPGEFARNVTHSSKQADWLFIQWMVSL